jgi:hypothetical protein
MEKGLALLTLFCWVYIIVLFTKPDVIIGAVGKDISRYLLFACGGFLVLRSVYLISTQPGRFLRIFAIGEIFRLLR